MYGLEVGADISLSLDLDKIYMFDAKPDIVIGMLYRILKQHLNATKNAMPEVSATDIVSCFSDTRTFYLLARAAEGNPRDFICLLFQCIIELENERKGEYIISEDIVYNAAHH